MGINRGHPLVSTTNKKFEKNVFFSELDLIHQQAKNDFISFKFWKGKAYAKEFMKPLKLYRVKINVRQKELVFNIYRGMEYNRLARELRNRKQADVDVSKVLEICMPMVAPVEMFDFLNN